jgi:uncharacterized HAD superfamily protein
MRLGFDLDEVIVNLTAEFERYLKETYGVDWPESCFVAYDFNSCVFDPEDEENNQRIIDDMNYQVSQVTNLTDAAEPYEEAVEAIRELRRRGHKIYFITSRPKRLQPMTYKWLRRHGIPFDSLKVIGKDVPKGVYGRNLHLDMFVDDIESNLESMWKFKKRWRKGLLLLDKPWNRAYHDGSRFKRVYDWQEILRHVGVQNR